MRKITICFSTILLLFLSFRLSATTILAAAKENGKWGFIDENGKWVIEPRFDNVKPFQEGLAAANEGYKYNHNNIEQCTPGKWGFIDKSGKWVVEPQFEKVESFREGFAKVNVGAAYKKYQGISLIGGKWGFINKDGSWFIEPNDNLYSQFSEGLCAFKALKGSYWGYIDKNNKEVIKAVYWEAHDFHDGMASVMGSDFQFVFIDKTGKQVFDQKFKKAYNFSDARAFVIDKSDLPEFIGPDGKYFFKIENLEKKANIELAFSEGLVRIPVTTADGKNLTGFADKSGKWIIEPKYELASDFQEGFALVFIENVYRFVDMKGNIAIPVHDKYVVNPGTQVVFKGIPNPHIGLFSQGLCRISEAGKWGFMNKKGQLSIKLQYEDVMDFTIAD